MSPQTSDQQSQLGRGPGYLPPHASGIDWMLDPASPALRQHARNQAAGPESPADYADYVADAAALKHLLRHRHVALVRDPERAHAADEIVDKWTKDLLHRTPQTLAGCAATLGRDLGLDLGDGHLHVRHSQHHRPAKEVGAEDPGPAWEVSTTNGTRIVRIRTLAGSDGADAELLAGAANHAADFSYSNIVVDLRGNGGGDDSYITSWFSPHAPELWAPPCEEHSMTLSSSGASIAFWNYAAWLGLNNHTVPEAFRLNGLRPARDDRVAVRTSPGTRPDSTSRRHVPWTGRMIVVIDGGTGSSAESAALLLKSAFGAVLVGTPSYGVIDYGNSTPYYLPASGMEIHLPSQANSWGMPVDFVGIQPDISIPAGTNIETIASNFENFHPENGARASSPDPESGQKSYCM